MKEKRMQISDARKNLANLFEDGTDRVLVTSGGTVVAYIVSPVYVETEELLRRHGGDPSNLQAVMERLQAHLAEQEQPVGDARPRSRRTSKPSTESE